MFVFATFIKLTVRNEFTELLFNTCSRYIESRENSKLLEEIKGPLWAYLRQCPFFFLAWDCNAYFSQIFGERTFGELTPDEMNIFSSLRTFQSFCDTCQKDVVLNSSCTDQVETSTSPPPPRGKPRAFELLKIGLFKFPPPRAKMVFKCPTLWSDLSVKSAPPKEQSSSAPVVTI